LWKSRVPDSDERTLLHPHNTRRVCAQALSALSATKAPLREAWAAWNPQRAAALDLQRQVDAGTLTLQVGWVAS
jgi:hypothetical protein